MSTAAGSANPAREARVVRACPAETRSAILVAMPAQASDAQRVGEVALAGHVPADEDLRTLVDQACAHDPDVAHAASVGLFRDIVEPLADRFEPILVDVYVQLFARVVDFARNKPRGAALDERLRNHGLPDAAAIVERWRRLVSEPAALPKKADSCIVLSRVTLGADVAVTSVFLDAARRRWPDAEILLAGGTKTAGLFDGEPSIGLLETPYPRGGTLFDRFDAYLRLAESIERLADEGEVVVLDPDSRLTQLGLLPVAPAATPYWFFPSRSAEPESGEPLAEIAGKWAAAISPGARPFVALGADDLARGRRSDDAQPAAAVSWGFGGNERKRVGARFEADAVKLLVGSGYRVILDRGAGAAEYESSQAVLAAAGAENVDVWEGSLSGFAGHIAAADLYVGYDSAAGHLAAALGVRGVDVFKGAVNRRMLARWSPWGEHPAGVLAVAEGEPESRTLERFAEMLR